MFWRYIQRWWLDRQLYKLHKERRALLAEKRAGRPINERRMEYLRRRIDRNQEKW